MAGSEGDDHRRRQQEQQGQLGLDSSEAAAAAAAGMEESDSSIGSIGSIDSVEAGGARRGGVGSGDDEEPLVVGYAFLAKKMGTMGKIVQASATASSPSSSSSAGKGGGKGGGIRYTPIDVDRPLEEQGPFDAILHKLSEDVVHRDSDPAAARRLANLEDYVARHPRTAIIEHPRDIARIVSRTTTNEALRALSERAPEAGIRPPRFILLEAPPPHPDHTTPEQDALLVAQHARAAIAAAPFSYPVIGKPVEACGTHRSHQLVVLGSEAGAAELLTRESLPMVIQEYANHDGVLFKVYVLGPETIRVFERRSLPNLGPHARSVAFNSQRPYPQRADFEGSNDSSDDDDDDSDGDDDDDERGRDAADRQQRRLVLSPEGEERIRRAARLIGRAFNLEVFGFDVLLPTSSSSSASANGDNNSGSQVVGGGAGGEEKWLVVDVNYFPSFKEVEDFPQLISAFLRSRVRQHRASPLLEQE